jgi:DNA-binding CsgD family transcriptional regulator
VVPFIQLFPELFYFCDVPLDNLTDMYTHIYYYIDKHNRLSDFGTHRGDTKELAEGAYEDELKKNPRMRARKRAAIKVVHSTVPTSYFITQPSFPFDDIFILACCVADFTKTQIDLMVLLNEGKSNKEIQQALNIGEDAVEGHLKKIYAKLIVHSRGEAVAIMRAAAQSLLFLPTHNK